MCVKVKVCVLLNVDVEILVEILLCALQNF